MKIKKFNKILSRLNVLTESVSGSDEISSLEVDLIKKHLLEMYELTLDGPQNSVAKVVDNIDEGLKTKYDEVFDLREKVVEKIDTKKVELRELADLNTSSTKPKELTEVSEPAIVSVTAEDSNIDRETSLKQSIPKESSQADPIIEYSESESRQASSPIPIMKEEHEEIFEQETTSDLSERLSETPISDLTKSMGINERMLTINELFNGDNSSFKKALSELNEMTSFIDAKQYISEQLIEKYNWVHPKKRKKAKIFIKLVKRRFN